MNNRVYPFFYAFLFMIASCETSHTSRKLIINESDFDCYIDYNNAYVDTVFYLTSGDYLILSDFTKLGCHPDGLATSPCSINPSDTITVTVNSILPYSFIGDFRDEYSWEETLSGNRATVQGCSFTLRPEHIVLNL